jgi:2-oxoisovalerate dehydrogenase E2 component (dihydrolipoyl transacylase)
VAVGTVICLIETEAAVEEPAAAPSGGGGAQAPAPAPAPAPAAPAPAPVAAQTAAPAPMATTSAAPAPTTPGTNGGSASKRLSPAVARLLEEHNLTLDQVPAGTGEGGRVTKQDVERYVEQLRTAPAPAAAPAAAPAPQEAGFMRSPYEPTTVPMPAPAPAPAPVAAQAPAPAPAPVAPAFTGPGDQLVALTNMRKAIAEHMVRSVHTAPHSWTCVEVDMQRVWNYRERIKAAFQAREGIAPSFLAFVTQALIAAAKQHPYVNATWTDEGILLKREISVGLPIDLGDQGLIVPVVHNADSLSFVGLNRAINDLAARARAGKLRLDDIQGSTITMNNTGSFGSVLCMPILNQPNVANVTMEQITKRVVVVDDMIAIRPIMNMCITLDHRVLDGAAAGRFMQTVKHSLENFQEPDLGY